MGQGVGSWVMGVRERCATRCERERARGRGGGRGGAGILQGHSFAQGSWEVFWAAGGR